MCSDLKLLFHSIEQVQYPSVLSSQLPWYLKRVSQGWLLSMSCTSSGFVLIRRRDGRDSG